MKKMYNLACYQHSYETHIFLCVRGKRPTEAKGPNAHRRDISWRGQDQTVPGRHLHPNTVPWIISANLVHVFMFMLSIYGDHSFIDPEELLLGKSYSISSSKKGLGLVDHSIYCRSIINCLFLFIETQRINTVSLTRTTAAFLCVL